MIRKGSIILNNVFGRKTPELQEHPDFSEEKNNLVEILQDKKKTTSFIKLIIADDKNNYCVKIRFCAAVIEYEKIKGTELEHKMKQSLCNIFLDKNSMFKIKSEHKKDLIKIKNELINLFLEDQYILNILNILKDNT